MKQLIKHILASAIYYCGLLAILRLARKLSSRDCAPLILMYHRVLPDPYSFKTYTQPAMSVSVQTFERQMQYIARNYQVLPLTLLATMIAEDRPIPRNCAVITFDDGWRDNYLYAYPILKKFSLPATIFLTTDYIGTDRRFWFLKIGFLLAEGNLSPKELADAYIRVCQADGNVSSTDRLGLETKFANQDLFINQLKLLDSGYVEKVTTELIRQSGVTVDGLLADTWTLSWEEIADMDSSLIEYGSHSRSHRILVSLSSDEIRDELTASKQILEAKLNRSICSFAYPNGEYDDAIKRLVQESGYLCAITTRGLGSSQRRCDLYSLNRIGLHEGATEGPAGKFSRPIFACVLEGLVWQRIMGTE